MDSGSVLGGWLWPGTRFLVGSPPAREEETAGANAVVGVDVGRVIAVPVGDPPLDVTVLRQWGQASAEAIGREQTLAQLEGVAMG